MKVVGTDEDYCLCGECGKESKFLLQVGEYYDSESRTAFLCLSCLQDGVAMLQKAKE